MNEVPQPVKPLLLDVFCGAGGCSEGYRRAGFDVVGIDNNPKPLRHYPFPWACMDALKALRLLIDGQGITFSDGRTYYLRDFAAIHASPPCQRYSTCTPDRYKRNHPDSIQSTRRALRLTGKPFVIENVSGARRLLLNPVRLCGSMFGLPIRRHRYFESFPDWFPLVSRCDHSRPIVYVSGTTGSAGCLGRFEFKVWERAAAMETTWMTDEELDQAIPPAYTDFIGKHLMAELGGKRG